jgi:hypothetical protein
MKRALERSSKKKGKVLPRRKGTKNRRKSNQLDLELKLKL